MGIKYADAIRSCGLKTRTDLCKGHVSQSMEFFFVMKNNVKTFHNKIIRIIYVKWNTVSDSKVEETLLRRQNVFACDYLIDSEFRTMIYSETY